MRRERSGAENGGTGGRMGRGWMLLWDERCAIMGCDGIRWEMAFLLPPGPVCLPHIAIGGS